MALQDKKETGTQFETRQISDVAARQASAEKSADRLKRENRLKWKLDIRLMGTCMVIFILNYIDRNALTSARLQGLEQDLKLTDTQYQAALAILYASYSPMQVPSNMILNYISRPSWYIAGCTMLWGVFSMCTGFSKGVGSLLATRLLIGFPEAAFYCGSMFMLSRWYTKREYAQRGAILYVGLLLSNAFGPLIAAGILGNMEGKLGHRAWRWLFYIEGAITIAIGLIALFLLPDYPHNTRWLSEEDRHLAQQRVAEDVNEADEDATGLAFVHGLKLAIKDFRVPLFMVGTCAQLLGLSYTNFFPTLTKTLGYNNTQTLLLTAPPWILCAIICVVNGWHSDKKQERTFHILWTWWATVIGYIMMMATQQTAVRYVSLFLLAVSYAGFALTLVFAGAAFPRPPAKRAAAFGLINGFGNLGNLMGSFVWKAEWGPSYRIPAGICLASLMIATAIFLYIRYTLQQDNKKFAELSNFSANDPKAMEVISKYAALEDISIEEAVERRKTYRFTT